MPRVLIKDSSFEQLQNNLIYTIIIRQHGFIIKQITNDESLESVFITKIEPTQIKKFQLLEKNKELILYSEFTAPDNKTYSFAMTSLELPVSILFDKIMKIIDPYYEEKSLLSEENEKEKSLVETQNEKNFLVAFDKFVKKTQSLVTQPFIQGLKIVQLGIQSLERSIKAGIESISKPFNKIADVQEKTTLLEKDVQLTECLVQVNKLYLNHIDSALVVDSVTANGITNHFLNIENSKENTVDLDKRTVILLHPFGLDLTIWKPYINYFTRKNYRVIAFDMRGWGASEQQKNDDYKFSDYYSDLMSIMEKKNLLEKENDLIIVTASITGLMLLNKIDDRLIKRKHLQLILLSSSDHITKDVQDIIKKMPSPKTWGPLKRFGKKKIKEIILTKGIENERQEEIISKLLSSDNKVTFETLKNLREKEYLDGLNENQLKQFPFERVLLILGEKDLFVPVENAKHLNSINNVTIRVMEQANHFIAFERPEVIVEEIDNWLQS